MTVEALRCALLGVSAYRNITAQPLMADAAALLEALSLGRGEEAVERYARVFYALRQAGCQGLGDWLWDALRYEEAPYPLLAERGERDSALECAARRDIGTFRALAELDCGELVAKMGDLLPADLAPVLEGLPRWSAGAEFTFENLTEFYRRNGAGLFARYRAFLWEGGALTPVERPDCFGGEELLGYEREREQVIANTRAMLEGREVNNVLLYGEPGTGKSVTVKSLITVPGFEDLRLIQVQKESLGDMPELIRTLGHRRQKFILFIDDLAFDQDDRTYSVLKTILEGGLEPRPANVAVYATSNRRHLVRQTFSDRAGDEVDRNETINEKTSLAERFGLRVLYQTLNKAQFLDMVEQMAALRGIAMDREALRAAAAQFEVRHPGKTPRTARQFIASLGT
ncbi:MAG TPA: DUF815 domain-containing protein [Candidatus Galloscillospira excrementavium]|nr:DUF815 domain-containing protein [Candidatus Galloscillospira excrementavium]